MRCVYQPEAFSLSNKKLCIMSHRVGKKHHFCLKSLQICIRLLTYAPHFSKMYDAIAVAVLPSFTVSLALRPHCHHGMYIFSVSEIFWHLHKQNELFTKFFLKHVLLYLVAFTSTSEYQIGSTVYFLTATRKGGRSILGVACLKN